MTTKKTCYRIEFQRPGITKWVICAKTENKANAEAWIEMDRKTNLEDGVIFQLVEVTATKTTEEKVIG